MFSYVSPLTRLLLMAFFSLGLGSFFAITNLASAKPVDDTTDFQILGQRVTEREGRQIVFNRVVPPDLPERAVKAKPPLRKLTSEESERMEARAVKNHVSLLVEAVVYDRTVSELRWKQDERSLRCWSNMDLNLFGAFPTVETEDTVYQFFILTRNLERESTGETNETWIPEITDFPQDRADYRMVGSEGEIWEAGALAAIEALHLFYEENETSLKNAYELRQAAREERERELRENPPPRDIAIHFWPMNSRGSVSQP